MIDWIISIENIGFNNILCKNIKYTIGVAYLAKLYILILGKLKITLSVDRVEARDSEVRSQNSFFSINDFGDYCTFSIWKKTLK